MTTKTLKEIYKGDLDIRFPDHTFTETTVGSMTKVEYEDGASALVFESTRLDVGDAYKNIRDNVVGTAEDYALKDNTDTVQTTDNTVTTITTLHVDDEAVYVIEATVLGIESDNSERASYRIVGSFYRTGGGNATQINSTEIIFGHETDSSWTGATFTVSGENILVQVQGASSTTINWECVENTIEFET